MDVLALPEVREIVFRLLVPGLRPEDRARLEVDWERLREEAVVLGREVLACEDEGLWYAVGAQRRPDWRALRRAHYGIFDLLHREIPEELVASSRAALERARALDSEGFGQDLLVAAAHEHTPASALVRFALYQLIRLNVWLMTWDHPRVEALGAMAQMDIEAQQILHGSLGDPITYASSSRPLVVLVAEAMAKLVIALREKEALLAAGGAAHRGFHEDLTHAVRLARSLGAADAHVVRDAYAEYVGDQHLPSVELSERHPRALPSAEATDARRSRLAAAVRKGTVTARARLRFVDMVREVYLDIEVQR